MARSSLRRDCASSAASRASLARSVKISASPCLCAASVLVRVRASGVGPVGSGCEVRGQGAGEGQGQCQARGQGQGPRWAPAVPLRGAPLLAQLHLQPRPLLGRRGRLPPRRRRRAVLGLEIMPQPRLLRVGLRLLDGQRDSWVSRATRRRRYPKAASAGMLAVRYTMPRCWVPHNPGTNAIYLSIYPSAPVAAAPSGGRAPCCRWRSA